MLRLDESQRQDLLHAVERVADPVAAAADVARLYAEFAVELDRRQPCCDRSGRCCRFESHGHRLFVSTIELVAFVAGLHDRKGLPNWDGTGCVYQVDGLCSVHDARPFGCRVYFCDPTAETWQQDEYEAFHARLKALHERWGVPYRYVEWREALRALGLAEERTGTDTTAGSGRRSLPVL